MRNFSLLLFLVLLPALGALGHDLYKAFDTEAMAFKDTGLRFTALGKFWVDYSRESFTAVREGTDPETWKSIVDPLLHKPAALVLLAPAVPVIIIQVLLLLFGKEGFIRTRLATRGRPRKKRDFTYNDLRDGTKKMKYKRK